VNQVILLRRILLLVGPELLYLRLGALFDSVNQLGVTGIPRQCGEATRLGEQAIPFLQRPWC
jgi:hypothetical protein